MGDSSLMRLMARIFRCGNFISFCIPRAFTEEPHMLQCTESAMGQKSGVEYATKTRWKVIENLLSMDGGKTYANLSLIYRHDDINN